MEWRDKIAKTNKKKSTVTKNVLPSKIDCWELAN